MHYVLSAKFKIKFDSLPFQQTNTNYKASSSCDVIILNESY